MHAEAPAVAQEDRDRVAAGAGGDAGVVLEVRAGEPVHQRHRPVVVVLRAGGDRPGLLGDHGGQVGRDGGVVLPDARRCGACLAQLVGGGPQVQGADVVPQAADRLVVGRDDGAGQRVEPPVAPVGDLDGGRRVGHRQPAVLQVADLEVALDPGDVGVVQALGGRQRRREVADRGAGELPVGAVELVQRTGPQVDLVGQRAVQGVAEQLGVGGLGDRGLQADQRVEAGRHAPAAPRAARAAGARVQQSAAPLRQDRREQHRHGQGQDADLLAARADRLRFHHAARAAAEDPAPAGHPVLALDEQQQQVAGRGDGEPEPAAVVPGEAVADRVERQQRQTGQRRPAVGHRDGVHRDGDQADRGDQDQPQPGGGRRGDRVLLDVVQSGGEDLVQDPHRGRPGQHPAGTGEAEQHQQEQHQQLPDRHRPAVQRGAAQARADRGEHDDHQDGVGQPAA